MGEKKVTKISIKVDLQCRKCYKKIKKILCSFPEIRDQTYDEKKNTVTITVVCCSPEKIMDKIRCKGGIIIQCIEIIQDKPSKPPDPPPKPPPQPPIQLTVTCCCPPYGPCCCGYRLPPLMCSDGCGRLASQCLGGNRGYYVGRCDSYFCEENATGCTIM